jgi:hypothetical protein
MTVYISNVSRVLSCKKLELKSSGRPQSITWNPRQWQKRRKTRRTRIHSKCLKQEIEILGFLCRSADFAELSSDTGPETEQCVAAHAFTLSGLVLATINKRTCCVTSSVLKKPMCGKDHSGRNVIVHIFCLFVGLILLGLCSSKG